MRTFLREADLDPVKDARFIERIAHAKKCQNWSIIENACYCPKASNPEISTPEAIQSYIARELAKDRS